MELFKFEEKSKYGYHDENGAIIIPVQYEDAKDFEDGFAIVKYNNLYGVIDSSNNVVIDFCYTAIDKHFLFYRCEKNKNERTVLEYWYNRKGIKLHEGEAKILSENLLCITNGNKFGVINQNGNRIINCFYDEIIVKEGLIIVLRKDKLGLYDSNGNLILDSFCDSIESVEIENNPMVLGTTTFPDFFCDRYYPGYCKEYFFDPNGCRHRNDGSIYDLLFRREITVRNVRSKWVAEKMKSEPIYEIYCWRPIIDPTKPMILSTGNSKIIFTKSEGLLPNSEFDDIQQITQICYVVKKDNLFGVYRIDTKNLVIPIEYECIRFYGGHTVLVRKDKLWGAMSLGLETNVFNILFKVSIPCAFEEIKILDDYQNYFGCKRKSSCSSTEYYTIVLSNGEEIEGFDELKCDSQFVYIDDSCFLTSIEGKFGIVNSKGQKIIPFKYDEFSVREDGRFDVRIDNRWGVLTADGFEVFRIKYSSPIPKKINKEVIVKDAESECFGLLASDGDEILPTIYEHLLVSDDPELYYFGCGGFEREDSPNFFSGVINDALWGVVCRNSKQIIEAKYMNFKINSGYIIAGRDGGYFPDTDANYDVWYGANFGGVYDLYNKEGELLIGGFRKFAYDERNDLFIFFFGGDWKEYSAYDDDWNNIHITGCRFDKGLGLWLILDKDFKTLLRDNYGKAKQFEKGFIGTIKIKEENNKIRHIYNMPIEFMAKGFSHVAINSVIINDSNSDYHKSQAVDIKTGKKTKLYSKIEQITESLFFFAKEEKAGITTIENELLKDCLFITNPVCGFYFFAKEIDDSNSYLELRHLNFENVQIVAISKIKTSELIDKALYGRLKMEGCETTTTELENIIIPKHDIFEKDFANKISPKESNYFCSKFEDVYWFSNDCRMEKEDDFGGYCDSDGDDNMRDSWDAMTDGMYGDMPDGFDGDFDFLGR